MHADRRRQRLFSKFEALRFPISVLDLNSEAESTAPARRKPRRLDLRIYQASTTTLSCSTQDCIFLILSHFLLEGLLVLGNFDELHDDHRYSLNGMDHNGRDFLAQTRAVLSWMNLLVSLDGSPYSQANSGS